MERGRFADAVLWHPGSCRQGRSREGRPVRSDYRAYDPYDHLPPTDLPCQPRRRFGPLLGGIVVALLVAAVAAVTLMLVL